ncbi:hypothetical protein KP509_10G036800 [Ceratopteris richardii]|uniref:Uncharacterized protein n=1 Tax=Ceratopteris richardii TaxID=49495 RepID=A0A8T2TUZ5_CERRI|nr:hypothetical protein KP509_10G036800 [Ceratopteris richardii]
MPYNEYYEYFGPEYSLHLTPSNMENQNKKSYLENLKVKLLDNLSKLTHVPNVPFHEIPPETDSVEQEEAEDYDVRPKSCSWNGDLTVSDIEDQKRSIMRSCEAVHHTRRSASSFNDQPSKRIKHEDHLSEPCLPDLGAACMAVCEAEENCTILSSLVTATDNSQNGAFKSTVLAESLVVKNIGVSDLDDPQTSISPSLT